MGNRGLISEEDKSRVESVSLTKLFEKACPIYMSYGMSYNDFWYGPQNNPDNQLDPVWKRQQELASVTRANIEMLSKARPYPENANELLNQYELKKLREMDKGCMQEVLRLSF